MDKNRTLLLSASDIKKKIERISYEILENCDEQDGIILAGIKESGYKLAEKLSKQLKKFSSITVMLCSISLDKAKPTANNIACSIPTEEFRNKTVIIVDDVAHTGRTLFYAMKPLMDVEPKQVQVMVLIDRKHKQFPIVADYVGLLLSTNMQEHITVEFGEEEAVYVS